MEQIGAINSERKPYESYVKLQEIIESNIVSCKSKDLKLIKINELIEVFDDLESFIYLFEDGDLSAIRAGLGVNFEDLVNDLSDGYRLSLISKLKDIALDLKNSPEVENVKSTAEEVISVVIEKVLKSGSLQFSTKLDRTQIEYLVRNPNEYNNFITILEAIGRIKMLPSVNGKNLSIKHLTVPINHFKVGFTGRMTATRDENTKKFINLSNCVETNLSGADRFIFSLENTVDKNSNNQTLISIKVLGKPPYKH
jgi:hypothetical protein